MPAQSSRPAFGRDGNDTPLTFAAAWVSGPDDAFAELMKDGTFDLCMIEGYSVC